MHLSMSSIYRSAAILFVSLAITFAYTARANDTEGGIQSTAAKSLEVIEDESAGAIRFVIDGREVARIDRSGLRVLGDITYGGSLTDVGPSAMEGQGQGVDKASADRQDDAQ